MKSLTLLFLIIFLSSTIQAASTCTFRFDEKKSEVKGEGFKTTDKIGVEGVFPGFKLNKNTAQKSMKELLEGLVVTVDLMTLDSGNSLRDKNLRETLFAGILGDSVAKVSVIKVNEKNIETQLQLNDQTQKIKFTYQTDKKGNLLASGTVDVLSLMMGDQVAALKKRCGSLHTGSDGKSVTWTEFKLSVKAKMIKKCS